MTTAHPTLMEARALLLQHLNIQDGAHPEDLDPAEVGIVGGPAHVAAGTSYHLGEDQLQMAKRPYSVFESARDRAGLNNHATAMDVGEFRVRTDRGTFTLTSYNAWLVGLCKNNDPDTLDIREVIYTLDRQTVKRFDRLGVRSTGDDSHLWHTHTSWFRDFKGNAPVRLAARWINYIGLGDDMTPEELRDADIWANGYPDAATNTKITMNTFVRNVARDTTAMKATLAAILEAVKGSDTQTILARIDQVAAAEIERDAQMRALVEQAQAGQLDAEEVVRRMGQLLNPPAPTS